MDSKNYDVVDDYSHDDPRHIGDNIMMIMKGLEIMTIRLSQPTTAWQLGCEEMERE